MAATSSRRRLATLYQARFAGSLCPRRFDWQDLWVSPGFAPGLHQQMIDQQGVWMGISIRAAHKGRGCQHAARGTVLAGSDKPGRAADGAATTDGGPITKRTRS